MSVIFSKLVGRIKALATGTRPASADRVSRVFKFRYACFKDLLASNTELLNLIADIEEKLRGQHVFGMSYVKSQASRCVFHTLRMVKSLDDLSGHRYPSLFTRVDEINVAIEQEVFNTGQLPVTELVLPYSRVTREMVDWVGGKNANLGELLNRVHLPVPVGFAITTKAYRFFLESNDLVDEIDKCRMSLDADTPHSINQVSEEIQRLIITAPVPAELEDAILKAYDAMSEDIRVLQGRNEPVSPRVALRSSAIGEDSELSYAGQYLSVLNVAHEKIIETYKYVLASLFTPRALSYRLNKGMRDDDIAMSAACIEMVESVASGVAFSRNPSKVVEDTILINAVWGLGPYAVDGVIRPDAYVLSKDDHFAVLEQDVSEKAVQLVADPFGGLKEIPVDPDLQRKPCLTPEQLRLLGAYVAALEKHYQYPQDVEWAIDSAGRIIILQTRPLHLEQIETEGVRTFPRVQGYRLLVEGGMVAVPGVGYGPAFHVSSENDLVRFPEGGVLIARHSDPQFAIVLRHAQAIVTDVGSITGHMASLAREFGVPTILDAKNATTAIPPGARITVDAYSGRVYQGQVPELIALRRKRESPMKDTPVFETLKKVAQWIVPLNLVDPSHPDFTPQKCETLHDIMRFVHEFSYKEMFRISDLVSDTEGGGALKLRAPIPLDLHIIDLGGGLSRGSAHTRSVTTDKIASIPFHAVLTGMLDEKLRSMEPKAIDLGGFFSVVREQMFTPTAAAERFGDRSYAIISDHYLNFSSRIGYHYSVLDSYCCDTPNKNYITFAFKGGAADEIRRNRRVRTIANIFRAFDFRVEVREDRVDARFYKYDEAATKSRLEMLGRLLQFTRQMDMLMHSESSVESITRSFLAEDYSLSQAPLVGNTDSQ